MRSLQVPMTALIILFALLIGCDVAHKVRAEPTPVIDRSFSWDQQTLKANDSGCPASVYVAPNGNLELCE
jgi:hypothetical protein